MVDFREASSFIETPAWLYLNNEVSCAKRKLPSERFKWVSPLLCILYIAATEITEEREDRPRGLETWTSIWSWARRETWSSLLRQHGSSQEIQWSYKVVFPWVDPKVGAVSHPISVLMTSLSRWRCCQPSWRCLRCKLWWNCPWMTGAGMPEFNPALKLHS